MFQVEHSLSFWYCRSQEGKPELHSRAPPQLCTLSVENPHWSCGSAPRPQENKISLTLASKVREAPRLLGFSCNPRTSSKSQKKPFPILLCPLSETHSALDLDPPSYLPVPTLLRGMCEARLGRAGQCRENEGEPSPTPRA